jgi:hypothetical protein
VSTKERPTNPFSGPMVRAILDGSKTQTRRVVKPVRRYEHNNICRPDLVEDPYAVWWHGVSENVGCFQICPYGTPGDRLWVRETWAVQHEYDAAAPSEIGASARWHYAATEDLGGLRKRPSIFLPRRGSRILLEITDVRVQRLQEISADDCRAEGHPVDWSRSFDLEVHNDAARDWYMDLWDTINGPGSWDANPWVWAITFQRLEP